MYILGIDQGIANLGYSIFNDEKLITYGCINTSSNDILEHRFYSLYLQIKDFPIPLGGVYLRTFSKAVLDTNSLTRDKHILKIYRNCQIIALLIYHILCSFVK